MLLGLGDLRTQRGDGILCICGTGKQHKWQQRGQRQWFHRLFHGERNTAHGRGMARRDITYCERGDALTASLGPREAYLFTMVEVRL